MSSESGRSLSGSISIPQWMKTKISDSKFGSEDFLSPPDNDDSFLFIYPKKIKEQLNGNSSSANVKNNNKIEIVEVKPQTFSKYENYTAPCKPFLVHSDSGYNTTTQLKKPSGTDDGFKGEAAKCGSSVIKMANQIISGKLHRNESESSLIDDSSAAAGPPPNFDPSHRRNSKSLPASPLSTPNTSPKSQRKMNKYFNGAFFSNENYQGSWILSSLLKKRDISKSVDQILEVDELDNHAEKVIKASKEFSSNISKVEEKMKNIYVPKPEEIREMNFWSPTTM